MLRTLSILLKKPNMPLIKGFPLITRKNFSIFMIRGPLGRSVDRSYRWPEEVRSSKGFSFGVPIPQSNIKMSPLFL